MSTKTFIFLIFGLLIFGGGLGSSFVAGLLVGKGQEPETLPLVVPSLPTPSSAFVHESVDPITADLNFENLRQRTQSGELSQGELTTLREQLQSQFGITGGPNRFTGSGAFEGRGPALTGTVTLVQGAILTLNTAQGDLQVSVGEDVRIRQTVEVEMEDLPNGTQITVIGQRLDNGTIAADTIQVIPEGMDFTMEGGFGNWSNFRGFGGRGGNE